MTSKYRESESKLNYSLRFFEELLWYFDVIRLRRHMKLNKPVMRLMYDAADCYLLTEYFFIFCCAPELRLQSGETHAVSLKKNLANMSEEQVSLQSRDFMRFTTEPEEKTMLNKVLSKIHGNVFQVFLGPNKVVVLTGYKTITEALVNRAEEFGDRHIRPIFKLLNKGCGIISANGESWKEMRRFALTNLRDFGMGKRGCEDKIVEEIQYLKEEFKKFQGKAFDTTQPVNYAVSNIISSIVYGSRFEYTDPRFRAMVHRANENVWIGGSVSILMYNTFPWLGPFLNSKRAMVKNAQKNLESITQLTSELLETLNPQDSRGFVDSFLIRKQSDEKSNMKNSHFHQDNLLMSVLNLFVAGTETTGTTLRWGLMIMAKYPHIQDRVQEEIDRVIGGRQPMVDDRKNLPYTDAVIHEVQRLANILPTNLPHMTSCDVTFNGYFIKKGTTVIPLLTSVLRDESVWKKPYSFFPEHFLDEKGQFVKNDAFMPFSAGRRICLGESLARMELFLFFTSLLQMFRFTPPPGVSGDELDLKGIVGMTLNPSPHKLCAIKRS